MTTELKSKGLEEILEAIKAQAKEGSCKTCQWCLKGEGFDHLCTEGEAPIEYECLIQGCFNAITFSQEHLDSEAYPWKCDEGAWTCSEEDGSNSMDIPGCLAYKPRTETAPENIEETAGAYRRFMLDLGEAVRLHNAIKLGKLEQLLEGLNAAL